MEIDRAVQECMRNKQTNNNQTITPTYGYVHTRLFNILIFSSYRMKRGDLTFVQFDILKLLFLQQMKFSFSTNVIFLRYKNFNTIKIMFSF